VLGVEDIRDLYYSRAFLEREVVMALAEQRLVPEKARASLRRLRDVETNPPLVEVVNVDVSFHSELVDAIGSPRLNRMYRSLMAEVRLCMAQVQANHLLSPSRIADEHSAILDRIENGDVDGALMHITEHLEQARTRLIAHVGSVAGKPEQRL
jgi:DNA-binding GntR family transcriptional regulator